MVTPLRLRDTRLRDQEITVSGRNTELRESGWAQVKTGTAKNAPSTTSTSRTPRY